MREEGRLREEGRVIMREKSHGSQATCLYPCSRDFEEDGFDGGLAETHSSGYLNLADIAEVLWKEGDRLREGGSEERRKPNHPTTTNSL